MARSDAWVLALGLAVTLALSLIAGRLPGMFAWGAALPRFLPEPLAIGSLLAPWLALLLALLSARGRGPAGTAERRPLPDVLGAFAAAVAVAALCWLLPDRIHFTGDFLIRLGSISLTDDPRIAFAQATPLDLAAFVNGPRWLVQHMGLSAELASRIVGLVLALALGGAGWAFARALDLRTGPTAAIAALVTLQPALALFTGYSKALAALPPLLLLAMASALNALSGRRGVVMLGLTTALAIALHRSGLALMLPWAITLTLLARDAVRERRRVGASWILAATLPVAALALGLPAMIEAMRHYDAPHFLPGGAADGWDRLNLLLAAAPLAPLILPLGLALTPRLRSRRDAWVMAGAIVPQLMVLLLIHPKQGFFRDWDVFATAGAALTMLIAWLVAESTRVSGRTALAFAVAVAGATPAIGWLAHWNDPALAESRIEAWLAGPPAPQPLGAASAWSFLATRAVEDSRWDRAATAYAHSIEAAPNPRTFVEWGISESLRGDPVRALQLYRHAATLDSNLTNAWLGLAASASQVGDLAAMAEARSQLSRLVPGHPQIGAISAYLLRNRGAPDPTGLAMAALPGLASRPGSTVAERAAALAAAWRALESRSDSTARAQNERALRVPTPETPSSGLSGP